MPAPARRPIVHHTACTTAVEKGPKKDKDPAAEEEGDDALDETAMRAAEIHEVLSGLKDFKNRIITGAFYPFFTYRFCTSSNFQSRLTSLFILSSVFSGPTADATKLAKKVRAPKKQLEAALASHPDILKIDGHIAELEEELKVLGDR